MCGRYTITTPTREMAEYFGIFPPQKAYSTTSDARPTQDLPIIIEEEPKQMVIGHWGYPIRIGDKEKEIINIRAESIIQKPFFQRAAKNHRCIILTDGFYEWKKDGLKQKYKFEFNKRPMALAGIYQWKSKTLSDAKRPFFSIITTTPNGVVAKVHDRMPVILAPGHEREWIGYSISTSVLKPFRGRLRADIVPAK